MKLALIGIIKEFAITPMINLIVLFDAINDNDIARSALCMCPCMSVNVAELFCIKYSN